MSLFTRWLPDQPFHNFRAANSLFVYFQKRSSCSSEKVGRVADSAPQRDQTILRKSDRNSRKNTLGTTSWQKESTKKKEKEEKEGDFGRDWSFTNNPTF